MLDKVWAILMKGAAWFLLVPLCLFGVVAVLSAGESMYFAIRAESASGTVVELRDREVGERSAVLPVFSFRDASEIEHTVVSATGSSRPAYQIGDTVPVLYRSGRPGDTRIGSYQMLFGQGLLTGTVVLVGVATFFAMGLPRWLRSRRPAT